MKILIEALEGYELIIALVLVLLFAVTFIYMAADSAFRKRVTKKYAADADRISEYIHERDLARDAAFELREELKKKDRRIHELERMVSNLEYEKKQFLKWEDRKNVEVH